MIVYDRPRPCNFRGFERTAHMASTLPGADGTAELIAFARRIGLRAQWIQNKGGPREHFDLFDGAIERADKAGAVEVAPREFITRVVRAKRSLRQILDLLRVSRWHDITAESQGGEPVAEVLAAGTVRAGVPITFELVLFPGGERGLFVTFGKDRLKRVVVPQNDLSDLRGRLTLCVCDADACVCLEGRHG